MRIRRHSRGKKYTGPYGAATVLRDEKNARVGFDAVAHGDRNATSGPDLAPDEKRALQKKIEQSQQDNRQKIDNSMIWMAITMSGVAVGLVVFVISGMIERGWFYPFELNLFELFTNPYVAIPCFVFLIINVTLSYRQRRRKSRVGNIED